MLKDPHKSFKLYYSISEVAAQFGVAESLLRYWEKEFTTLRPNTPSRKVRQYTADDIKEVQLIYNLVKVRGMKLSAARETISKNRQGATQSSELIQRLQAVRQELLGLKRELDDL